MKKMQGLLAILCLLIFTTSIQPIYAANKTPKPRIIITADPELDDNNSMIRFLLYSASFKVEGLVYASSQFHWKGDGKGTKFMVPGREYSRYGLNLCPCTSYRWKDDERFIHEAVAAYEKVYPNLRIHDANYPTPAYLKSRIKYGNIEFEGDYSKDTEGSNLIKSVILDDVPGPVYITAWGGQSTIARALKSIQDQYKNSKDWETIKKKISNKVILMPSGDQDGTYASYIKPNWPAIEYRQYKNGPNYGYGAQLVANHENAEYLTPKWMQDNVRSKGALGSVYRVWQDGKQMVKGDIFDYFGLVGYSNEELKKMGYIVWMPVQEKGAWLGEGDTGTFMNLLSNGLDAIDPSHPGGWSGRPFLPPATYIDPFSNDTSKVKDLVISANSLTKMASEEENTAVFPNFFPAAENDFAARMEWSVQCKYSNANHAPIIQLRNSSAIKAKAGDVVQLEAAVNDPDGDKYAIRWWQFVENQHSPIADFNSTSSKKTMLQIPADAKANQAIFVVVEVKDSGKKNNLTSYKLIKIEISGPAS